MSGNVDVVIKPLINRGRLFKKAIKDTIHIEFIFQKHGDTNIPPRRFVSYPSDLISEAGKTSESVVSDQIVAYGREENYARIERSLGFLHRSSESYFFSKFSERKAFIQQ